MYATQIEGQVLNLAVSGKLWRRSLIMQDEETQTLWSQLLAKGMAGKHKGVSLPVIPSALTDWGSWKRDYPSTSVIQLSRTGKEFRSEFYRQPEKFIVGLADFKNAKAWPFDELVDHPLINDTFAGKPVVVYFYGKSSAAYIYSRVLDDQQIKFEFDPSGQVVDTKSQSVWSLATGKAIDGPLKGRRLKALPAIPSFRKSWLVFYPKSEVWNSSDDQGK